MGIHTLAEGLQRKVRDGKSMNIGLIYLLSMKNWKEINEFYMKLTKHGKVKRETNPIWVISDVRILSCKPTNMS